MDVPAHRSDLPPWLIEAYRATRYEVYAEPPFTLQVDAHSADLAARLTRGGALFITAWNPRGEPQALAHNRERQDGLRAELRGLDLRFIGGFGAHAVDKSQGEESLLALGVDRVAACTLGARHEQNAVVWADVDAVPRLLLLR